MDTRAVVEPYFERLSQRGDWQSPFSGEMTFRSHTRPPRLLAGKRDFVAGTQRFYSSIGSAQAYPK